MEKIHSEVSLSAENLRKLFEGQVLLSFFVVVQIFVLLMVPYYLKLQGIYLQDFMREFFVTTARVLELKYSGELKSNLIIKIAIVLNYTGVMLGGVLIAQRSLLLKFMILVATFTPSFLYIILYGDKGTLFLSVSFFAGALIVAQVVRGYLSFDLKKNISRFFMVILVIFPALIISLVARGVYTADFSELISRVLFSLASYSSGHLLAFSDWFLFHYQGEGNGIYMVPNSPMGIFTFASFLKLFGVMYEFPPGVYSEYVISPGYFQSNIFSIFRGSLTDFGFYGSFLFWFVCGLIFNAAFYCLARGIFCIFAAGFFILFCGFIYTSFLISLFVWNSAFLAIILFVIFVFLSQWISFFGVGTRFMKGALK